jgi:hypothetical protein
MVVRRRKCGHGKQERGKQEKSHLILYRLNITLDPYVIMGLLVVTV